MSKPNIIMYFSDQQRADTIGLYGQKLDITPNLDEMGKEGIVFLNAYTAQPVCGPCRALFQTGKYPTETGCFTNCISLPKKQKTLANYFTENDYDVGYVGKWHLASDGEMEKPPRFDYIHNPIPLESRGGYNGFWRVSDVLEFTSHGYDGYVFDENMNKLEFTGYRCDCITDYGLEYLDMQNEGKPFFLTISHIEPHHQNDRNHYEGPDGSKEKYKNCEIPKDLTSIKDGDYVEEYPDYLGQCESLDYNLGRVIDKLKEKGLYENTIIVFVSDHGSHFRTRNKDKHLNGYDDYKRSGHDGCLRVPLVIGGGYIKDKICVKELVSTASLPKSLLMMAGVDVSDAMIGEDLLKVAKGEYTERNNYIFAQISESRVGRVIRTDKFKYAVYAPNTFGGAVSYSDIYEDDYMYDLTTDPSELNNIVNDQEYKSTKEDLRIKLIKLIEDAESRTPLIN